MPADHGPHKHWFDQLTYDRVMAMIERSEPEHLHLEFKSTPRLDRLTPDDEKNFAIILSALANSDGGIAIYGVATRKVDNVDVASVSRPFESAQAIAGRLSELCVSATDPPVRGVEVRPLSGSTAAGFVAVHVPRSERPPHMARLKGEHRYYQRVGDDSVRMEHYHIVDAFARNSSPSVRVQSELVVESLTQGNSTSATVRIRIFLRNEGRGVARFPYLRLGFVAPQDCRHFDFGVDGNGSFGLHRRAQPDAHEGVVEFAGGADEVIHPSTSLVVTACRCKAFVAGNAYPERLEVSYEVAADRQPCTSGVLSHDRAEVIAKVTEKYPAINWTSPRH